MSGLPQDKPAPTEDESEDASAPERSGIVTRLAQLVRITEDVKPEQATVTSSAIRQIGQLAHTLAEELSSHLRAQDKRIAELENLATTDPLTRVLNRRGFEDRMRHELSIARRHGVGGVLIFVDLDKFKPINDTYGHAAGDQVLLTVGNLLRGYIRETDYIGRLGGDEFAILLPRSNKRDGLRRAEELDRTLNNAHAQWGGQQIPIKASCGVHMYASNADVDELLESADAAMYKIKQERKVKTGTDAR